MNKKGFTLIEILGVMVLLGIVALIAVPTVNIVIKNSKKSALEQTISTLESAAYRYSNRNDLGYSSETQILDLNVLKEAGYIKNEELINPVTDSKLAGCIFYRWDENYKQYNFNYSEDCELKDLEVSISNVDGEFNAAGWSNAAFYVKIETNGTSYSYCVAKKKCNPNAVVEKSSGTVYVALESDSVYVCAYAMDGAITSETVCSELYKLDMTKPTPGTIEISGTQGENGWYTSDVSIKVSDGVDTLSGHTSTVVNKESLTDNTAGEKIIVTTTDKAGNVETREYIIKIDKSDPIVDITKSVENNKNVFTANTNNITSGVSYTWYKDGNIISGENGKTLTTTVPGTYKVKIKTGSGKMAESNEITVNSYTITYDVNGGTGSIASQTKIEDLSIVLSKLVPKRDGYAFMGWGLTSTSVEAKYVSGSTYTDNANLKLYAIWKKTYTVTFIANGATLSSTSESCVIYNGNSSCTVNAPTITRDGYDIIGFSTNSNATSYDVKANSTIIVNSNITYYAITSKTLIAYFDKNDAYSVAASNKTCTLYNTNTSCSITTPTITPHTNFTEEGYAISSDSINTSIADNSTLTLTESNSGSKYYALNSRYLTWTFDKNGSSSIGATSRGCTIWSTSSTCSITTPSITAASGYTKIGWGSSSSSTSSTIAENTSKTLSNSTTSGTYYAVQYKTVDITYNGNGADSGSVSDQSCTMYNTNTTCSITLRANGYSKTNYSFQGWSTNTTNPEYDASTSYDFSDSLDLNAIWYANYICSTGTLSYDSNKGYICTSSNAVKRYDEDIYTRDSYYTDWDCSTNSSASSCSESTGTYSKTTCSTNATTYTNWSCSTNSSASSCSESTGTTSKTTCSTNATTYTDWSCSTNSSASSCTSSNATLSKVTCTTNPTTYTKTVSTRTYSNTGGAWCQEYSYTPIGYADYSTEDEGEKACRGNSSCEYVECTPYTTADYIIYSSWEACDDVCDGSCDDPYTDNEYYCSTDPVGTKTWYRCQLMKASSCARFRTNCVSLSNFTSSHQLNRDYEYCSGDFYGSWTVSSTSTVTSCTESTGNTSKTECSTNATTYTKESCTRSANPTTYTKETCTRSANPTTYTKTSCSRDLEYTSWEYSTTNSGLTSCSESTDTYEKTECSSYYTCPSGWSTYSGSGSSMKCYQSATLAS